MRSWSDAICIDNKLVAGQYRVTPHNGSIHYRHWRDTTKPAGNRSYACTISKHKRGINRGRAPQAYGKIQEVATFLLSFIQQNQLDSTGQKKLLKSVPSFI